jgi:MFS family permease
MPKRYWLVVGMFLLSMLLYVDRVCISAAKKDIASELHLSETQMGWILSAFALGYALFQVPARPMADRFGPRAILGAVVTAWSIFTALMPGPVARRRSRLQFRDRRVSRLQARSLP